jgi:hypothetical protein
MFLKYRKAALAKELIPAMEKKIEAEMQARVEARLQEILRTSRDAGKEAGAAAAQALVPAAVAAAEAEREEDARSVVTPLETDWRRLLTERKKVLTLPPTGGSGRGLVELPRVAIPAAEREEVSVTVGDGNAPPSSPSTEGSVNQIIVTGSGASVASSARSILPEGPVNTEVTFS